MVLLKSLAKNSTFNLIYTLLNMLFPLITSAYVSRILLSEGIGRVAYVQTIVSYFVSFAALGLQNYGLREISRVRNDSAEKNKLFTQLLVFNFITTTIALLAYILLVLNTSNIRRELPLYIACGMVIIWNYFNVDWLYQGEEDYVYIVCRNILIKVLSLITVLLFVKTKESYVTYALITSVATGGNNLFNFFHSRKYVRFNFNDFRLCIHIKPVLILGLGLLIGTIYNKIDITMLGILTADANVGYYSYGHKIIDLILGFAIAITSVYLPRLCFLYDNNQKEFTKLLRQGVQVLMLLTPPMATGIFILAPQIICLLFGEAFLPSAKTVQIFAPILIIKAFGDLVCWQLSICTRQDQIRIPAAILASTTNILLNFALIPFFAERGAAIASVISELVVNGYQFVKLRKLVTIPMPKNTVVQAVVSTLIMSVCVLEVTSIIGGGVISLVISISAGVAVYFIVNLIMKNEIQMMLLNKVAEKITQNIHK